MHFVQFLDNIFAMLVVLSRRPSNTIIDSNLCQRNRKRNWLSLVILVGMHADINIEIVHVERLPHTDLHVHVSILPQKHVVENLARISYRKF